MITMSHLSYCIYCHFLITMFIDHCGENTSSDGFGMVLLYSSSGNHLSIKHQIIALYEYDHKFIRNDLGVMATDRFKAQLYHMFYRAPAAFFVPRAEAQVDQVRRRGHPRLGRPQIEAPRKGQRGSSGILGQTSESPEYIQRWAKKWSLGCENFVPGSA